jgi:glycerol-3-phosphate acyltransferase PlsY
MLTSIILAGVVGYFLGATPFGYLVARAKGVNIFEVGSKSPGATNVRRVLGRGPGNLVFALDALKGVAAAGWPRAWAMFSHRDNLTAPLYVSEDPLPLMVAGLVGALLGHSFSCFTRFKGGKGVATGAGGFLVLFPLGALTAAVVWALTAAVTRYVSLASMLAGVALTATAGLLHVKPLLFGMCAAVMVFVIIRHRANISRLIAGTETRIGQKSSQPASS